MDTIDRILAEVDRAWRAYGIASPDRSTLAVDLRLDLQAAAADGAEPARLLGDNVAEFAQRLAAEAGLKPAPREYGRLLRTSLIGAALAAVAAISIMAGVYPLLVRMVDLPRSVRIPVPVAASIYYGVPAATIIIGAAMAVARGRHLPNMRETARMMTLLLPVASILATFVTIILAWSTGYSTAPEFVVAETILVLGILAGTITLARRLTLGNATKQVRHPKSTPGSRPRTTVFSKRVKGLK